MRDGRPLVFRSELLNDPFTEGVPLQPPKACRSHLLLRIHAGMLQAPFGQNTPSVEGHGIEREHDLVKLMGQRRAGRYISSWDIAKRDRKVLHCTDLKYAGLSLLMVQGIDCDSKMGST